MAAKLHPLPIDTHAEIIVHNKAGRSEKRSACRLVVARVRSEEFLDVSMTRSRILASLVKHSKQLQEEKTWRHDVKVL